METWKILRIYQGSLNNGIPGSFFTKSTKETHFPAYKDDVKEVSEPE